MQRIHLFVAFFFTVICSTCCLTISENTFVNTTRQKFKILGVFGHLGKSHFDVFKPLLEELARKGHELTVVSYFPRPDKAKAKEPLPNYKDISLLDPNINIYVDVIDLQQIQFPWYRPILDLILLKSMADKACGICFQNSKIKELLQSDEKFDIILTETFNTDCFLGFIHRFKAPYIGLSSHQIMVWTNNAIGNPDDPSYVVSIFMHSIKPMNFFNRMQNAFYRLIAHIAYEYWFRSHDQAVANKAFGSDLPKLKEIAQQMQALLVNTHSSLHGNVPRLTNVVEIGGIHIPSKVNPLPKDVAEFLDNAHEGVLYFSFGSMIKMSSMSPEKLDMILNVIGSIPRKVIWKWENDELPRKLNNVMVKKWLPQFDMMNHPNVKCYMGHGGLLGLSEGVYVGLPMILIPMYGDQFHNAAAAVSRGVAIQLEFQNLNEQLLRHALDEIFNNTSYRENAQRLSKAYRDRPAMPLETAVWWTEYVARGNGRFYFRAESQNVSWYQSYFIDVALFLIIISAVFIYIFFRLLKLLRSLFKGKPRSQTMEESKKKN